MAATETKTEVETVTFIKHHVKDKLPPINKTLPVETRDGKRYSAAKRESAVEKNTYFFGLVFNDVIIGVVPNVEYWFEEIQIKSLARP